MSRRDGGMSLVGRTAELAAIHGLLGAADQGRGGALVLAGPAGIGKSALVRAALDAAPRFQVLRTAGIESETGYGYAGLHQLVHPILDWARELPEPQRAALDGALGRARNGMIQPFLVGLAALNLVAAAARAQPVLVVVDDGQWLDAESVTTVSFVARRLHAERVAVVVVTRDPIGEGPDARLQGLPRLDLVGLPPSEALELLTRTAAAPVEPSVARRIVAATEGNPLALVDLPAALTVGQLSGVEALPDPLPIGDRLSVLFAMRAEALDAGARAVLLLAAAEREGDPVLVRRAAEALDEVPWAAGVANAEASGLVTFAPRVEFRHPLARSAVYYSAAPADRRRAHAALADALDPDADIDRRAWHLGAAAAGPDERIARLLEASAERARERGGSATEAAYLRLAAELTPHRERAAERLLEAARAELVAGRGPQARGLLDRARANGLNPQQDADAAWTEALIHLVAGELREPAQLLAVALPQIGDGDPELAVGACVGADAIALAGGHLVEPSTRREIVAGTMAAAEHCDGADLITELISGVAARLSGERATAMRALHDAVASAADDPQRLHSVAGRHIHVVYFDTILAAADVLDDRAWDDLGRAWAQLSRAKGALAALPLALSWCSWLEVLQGRLGSALSHLTEIEDLVSLTGWRGLLGSPVPARVLRDAWLGDEDAARTGARRMMQDAHERGQGIGIDHAYAALTILELGAGRYRDALRAARRICEHDCVGVATPALADVVEAAVRSDECDVAVQALERLSERARLSATPWANGILARAQAVAASGGEADELYRSALDELSRTTIATEIARTQLLYGEWLRRARRRKDAREPLHDALDFFEAVGASSFAGRARAELAATGEHVRTRTAPVDMLTPQEAQIARLAAAGEKNHEIAAQLYITTSTVEYHLRKTFVKLGVSSRTQLAHLDLPA